MRKFCYKINSTIVCVRGERYRLRVQDYKSDNTDIRWMVFYFFFPAI